MITSVCKILDLIVLQSPILIMNKLGTIGFKILLHSNATMKASLPHNILRLVSI